MTRREHKLGTCWLVRLLRGLRPDRNPLRRGSDRAETVVVAVLLAAFLAAAPFAAQAAGHWAAASATRQAQAQRASLTQVTATLVRQAPVWSGYGSGTGATTTARWRAPDGQARSGEVFATADALTDGTVRIWVDHSGQLANPPLTRDQVAGRTQLAAGSAVAGLAMMLAAAGWLARRALDRRRLAGWDAEWLANGPRWSPRR
jgi:hypothetical protein